LEIVMKGIAGYLVAAVVLALAGAALVAASRIDRDLARAEESLVAQEYDDSSEAFGEAERYYEYGSRLPWIVSAPLNHIRAQKAALHYWQRDYEGVLPQQNDAVGAVAADNIDLQLVVANAVFRKGEAQAKDRSAFMQAIDQGISAYAAVLKNADRQEDAAYNYEYLVRLRDEVDKGKRKPGAETAMKGPEGATGTPPKLENTMGDFKIYIPLESQERQDQGVAGKAGGLKRKG
jgi:hypothetical protein